jgi:hypothetical protein
MCHGLTVKSNLNGLATSPDNLTFDQNLALSPM